MDKVPKKTAKPIKIKLHRQEREQVEPMRQAHHKTVQEEEEDKETL